MYGVRKGSGVLLWHLETRLSIIKNSWGARAVGHPVLGGIRESKRPGGVMWCVGETRDRDGLGKLS